MRRARCWHFRGVLRSVAGGSPQSRERHRLRDLGDGGGRGRRVVLHPRDDLARPAAPADPQVREPVRLGPAVDRHDAAAHPRHRREARDLDARELGSREDRVLEHQQVVTLHEDGQVGQLLGAVDRTGHRRVEDEHPAQPATGVAVGSAPPPLEIVLRELVVVRACRRDAAELDARDLAPARERVVVRAGRQEDVSGRRRRPQEADADRCRAAVDAELARPVDGNPQPLELVDEGLVEMGEMLEEEVVVDRGALDVEQRGDPGAGHRGMRPPDALSVCQRDDVGVEHARMRPRLAMIQPAEHAPSTRRARVKRSCGESFAGR